MNMFNVRSVEHETQKVWNPSSVENKLCWACEDGYGYEFYFYVYINIIFKKICISQNGANSNETAKTLIFLPDKIYLASERQSQNSAFQCTMIADLFSHKFLLIETITFHQKMQATKRPTQGEGLWASLRISPPVSVCPPSQGAVHPIKVSSSLLSIATLHLSVANI